MFSSRVLLNLGLVGVLAGLTTLAVYTSKDEIPVSEFSSLNMSDITSIQITANNTTTKINKNDNTWIITQPISVEADKFRIDAILSLLSFKQNDYYDIEKSEYSKFSLAQPLATLTLNQQSFLFGSTSPVNNKRYVLTNGKVFLIEDTFYPLISAGFKNLMSRYLFLRNTQFKKISFADNSIFLNKKLSWEHNNKTTSSDDLKSFIDNWSYIQAYAVTAAKTPYTGTEVSFTTIGNRTIKLLIQKTDINTHIINPELGLNYQFASDAYTALTQPSHFTTDSE